MDRIRIAVLCSTRLALPAAKQLVTGGQLCAMGVADIREDVVQVMSHFATTSDLPLRVFSRKGFRSQLINWLGEVRSDVVFVMTFPFVIPSEALKWPRLGFINFHYGLLPEMRGADPIFEGIRRRMTVAGTTIHIMDEGLDTGPILLREEIPCLPHFTYGILSGQLAMLGAQMCLTLVEQLNAGAAQSGVPQDELLAKYYPKVDASEIYLDWANSDSSEMIALICACNPLSKNGVPTSVNGWTIGVCDASIITLTGDASGYLPGTVLAIDPQNGLLVMTMDGVALRLEVVYTEEGYFPGHKLAHFGIAPGAVFSAIQ